jgi:hypothetical protein
MLAGHYDTLCGNMPSVSCHCPCCSARLWLWLWPLLQRQYAEISPETTMEGLKRQLSQSQQQQLDLTLRLIELFDGKADQLRHSQALLAEVRDDPNLNR